MKMMVPSSFLNSPSHAPPRHAYDEKENSISNTRLYGKQATSQQRTSRPQARSPPPTDASPTTASSPVRIPKSNEKDHLSSYTRPALHGQSRAREVTQVHRTQAASAAPLDFLLSSTTIPRRRPQGKKSQKLPVGDHVADFSKLLLEDVESIDLRTTVGSLGNPQFEDLFGHSVDKGATWRNAAGSTPAETPVSIRSMSTESMPSLLVDDDLTESSSHDLSSPSQPSQRCSPDRRPRLLSTSEDCSDDHPLQHLNILDPLAPMHEETIILPVPSQSPPSQKGRASSLRSNLTASLRAIKTAAQTVSSLATSPPTTRPDDFLTRSIFSFAPELTDDKRPPPSDDPPSPALRRYLNPHPKTTTLASRSPAEFHSYNEYPNPSPPTKKTSVGPTSSRSRTTTKSIQLQTCIPSAVRSPNASSPPIWLDPDGTPTTHPDLPSPALSTPNLARQREPRENAAFLRILVAEMNMRRSGKFDEAMESHACVWLPPRKAMDGQQLRSGLERWTVYTAA